MGQAVPTSKRSDEHSYRHTSVRDSLEAANRYYEESAVIQSKPSDVILLQVVHDCCRGLLVSSSLDLLESVLVEHPDKVNETNEDGQTPMHIASLYNNVF